MSVRREMNLSVPTILSRMADMSKFISVSEKEQVRFKLLQEIHAGRSTVCEISLRAHVSERTVFRWLSAVANNGVAGLVHGNRERVSSRKVPKKEAARIVRLVKKTYLDCTATLISEKLEEQHNIHRHPQTVTAILQEAKVNWVSPMSRSVRKGKSVHRQWRERRAHKGELVQFDGSYHDWFEGRGSIGTTCLLAAIDDATSEILFAKFAEHEGVLPVMDFWYEYAGIHGLPKSIYVDKFSTYRMPVEEVRLNQDTKTQLERAMDVVGTELIFANSSQAKGRVERLFRTLQDRLIRELRFKNISTTEDANVFLRDIYIPWFNKKFSVAAKEPQDFHRPVSKKAHAELKEVFVRRQSRVVQHDFTVSFETQWFQILSTPRLAVRPKDAVEVREYPNHKLGFFLRNKSVAVQAIPKRLPTTMRIPISTLT